MDLTLLLVGVAVVAIAVWVFMELRQFRRRIFIALLMIIVLLFYFSFAFVSLNKSISLSDFNGIKEAGGFYLSWLGSVAGNVKTLAGNAVKMNWTPNNSTFNLTNPPLISKI